MKTNKTFKSLPTYGQIESGSLSNSVVGIFCSKCDKPNVHCKGMCKACYSKMQRNTDKGKEQMKAYNLSAGKEAQKRYYERNRQPKPPKKNCECGESSKIKGYCLNCYHKYYQRKKYGYKEGAPKLDSSLIFNSVLLEVKKGFTIERACKNTNVSTTTLYNIISPIQKAELIACKIIGFIDEDY